jgi:hypothetical protein
MRSGLSPFEVAEEPHLASPCARRGTGDRRPGVLMATRPLGGVRLGGGVVAGVEGDGGGGGARGEAQGHGALAPGAGEPGQLEFWASS